MTFGNRSKLFLCSPPPTPSCEIVGKSVRDATNPVRLLSGLSCSPLSAPSHPPPPPQPSQPYNWRQQTELT